MKKTPIDSARPGDVVVRSVVSASGVTLITAGTALKAETIARLRDLGIDRVWLDGEPADATTPEQRVAEVEQRFAGHEHDPLMMELRAIVLALAASAGSDTHD